MVCMCLDGLFGNVSASELRLPVVWLADDGLSVPKHVL